MKEDITAIVLAGGQGSRLNHQDKGLVYWNEQPFIAHITQALAAETKHIVISCNRNHDQYKYFSDAIVSDQRENYQGPLAGLEAALSLVKTPLSLIYPCDCPIVPKQLVHKLYKTASKTGFACVHDGQRIQPLMSLFNTSYKQSIEGYLKTGQRSVIGWIKANNLDLPENQVDFSEHMSGCVNVNSLQDLEKLP